MQKSLPVIFALAALAGCQEAPRSVEYFAENETEARRVVATCTAGTTRSSECDNAAVALRRIASEKAMQHEEQPTRGGKGFTYTR